MLANFMVQRSGECDSPTESVDGEGVSWVTIGCEVVEQRRISVPVVGSYQSHQRTNISS